MTTLPPADSRDDCVIVVRTIPYFFFFLLSRALFDRYVVARNIARFHSKRIATIRNGTKKPLHCVDIEQPISTASRMQTKRQEQTTTLSNTLTREKERAYFSLRSPSAARVFSQSRRCTRWRTKKKLDKRRRASVSLGSFPAIETRTGRHQASPLTRLMRPAVTVRH